MDYQTLNAKPALDFLKPENFRTDFDRIDENRQYANLQYLKGLKIGSQAKIVHIRAGGTWAADMKDGSYLSSCEGVGYHACTADLLKGFLKSDCAIVVHRMYGLDAGQSILIK